jgi:predicted ester cyclase
MDRLRYRSLFVFARVATVAKFMDADQRTEFAVQPLRQTPVLLRELTLRWYDEIWNERRSGAIAQLMWDPSQTRERTSGKAGDYMQIDFRQLYRQMLIAFPDIWFTVDDVLVDGDMTVARWHAAGRHLGELEGLRATGKPFRVTGITMFNWKDGKVSESWSNFDHLGLLQQIGVVN